MDNSEKLRKEAEARVKLVKNADIQGKINSSDLQTIQNSYDQAKELFSAWIDNVQNGISKKIVGQPVNYNDLTENAAEQAKKFNILVDQTLDISARGGEVENLKAFIKTGKELYNTIKEIDQKKRQELITKLEKLRWKKYQEI